METPKFEFQPYFNLAWRRKWWIVIPAIVVFALGAVYAKVCPKLYRASSRILVQPQNISDSFIRSTVTENVQSRVQAITQEIHSRTNLEKVIREFGLTKGKLDFQQEVREVAARTLHMLGLGKFSRYFQSSEPALPILSLVEDLRQQISVRTLLGGNRNDQSMVFEISFVWHDPNVVAPVANAVASHFIESNLNIRQKIALSTTDFIDKETENIRRELEFRERELQKFKEDHMGMLPEQLQSNINILNQLREEVSALQQKILQERQGMVLVRSAVDQAAMIAAARPESDDLTTGSLQELEARLKSLSLKYTERHPDIIALKREIASKRAAGEGADTRSGDPAAAQLRQVSERIAAYEMQIEDLSKQVEIYKHRVEQTPHVEMAMTNIIRDYSTVQAKYQNMLAKKLDAKMAEEMERRQQAEQFKLLDSAVPPEKPFKPEPLRILLVTLAAGLGIGAGLAYLKEILDPYFYNPTDVASFLDAKVLVSLPSMEHELKQLKS